MIQLFYFVSLNYLLWKTNYLNLSGCIQQYNLYLGVSNASKKQVLNVQKFQTCYDASYSVFRLKWWSSYVSHIGATSLHQSRFHMALSILTSVTLQHWSHARGIFMVSSLWKLSIKLFTWLKPIYLLDSHKTVQRQT